MVPRTTERKVNAGSPSSRSDTTNRDTSMPTWARQCWTYRNGIDKKHSLTIANDRVTVHIFDIVVS